MMASPKKSSSWQDMRRALSSQSKTELLNLIRDLYALTPENKDIVRTQALTPKAPLRHQARVKDPQKHQAAQVAAKIRRLAQMATDLSKTLPISGVNTIWDSHYRSGWVLRRRIEEIFVRRANILNGGYPSVP